MWDRVDLLNRLFFISSSIDLGIFDEASSRSSYDQSTWSTSIAITKDDLWLVSLLVASNQIRVIRSRWEGRFDSWLTIVEFEPHEPVVRICSVCKLSSWALWNYFLILDLNQILFIFFGSFWQLYINIFSVIVISWLDENESDDIDDI